MQSNILSNNDFDVAVDAIITCYMRKLKEQQLVNQRQQEHWNGAKEQHTCTPVRILVALAGRPGSGKTTVANVIAAKLEDKLAECQAKCDKSNKASKKELNQSCLQKDIKHDNDTESLSKQVCVMSMDGYHLYRSELRAMANAEEAIRRRGAEWTFNPRKLYNDLNMLKQLDATHTQFVSVQVPSFDHGVGDPVEHNITIPGKACVVIVEGNYVLYRGTEEWANVYSCFDLHMFLFCDKAICTERLCRRHMKAWNISREEAMVRASGSDSVNGDLVDTTLRNANVVIHSCEATTTMSTPIPKLLHTQNDISKL